MWKNTQSDRRTHRPVTIATCTAFVLLATTGLGALTAVADVPSSPGDLLESRPFSASWLPDQTGDATWIRYATSGLRDEPAESTGFVLRPRGPEPAGGWPVLAWAHGTQGTADACAPTVSGPYAAERDAAYLGHFLERGYAIVASDYAGLGSEGEHAYLHGASVAHNVVDAVTAAHSSVDGGRLADRWAAVGHSQGAGAALVTANVASALDGPLDFRGMVGTGTPVRVADDILELGPGKPGVVAPPTVNAYVAYLLDGVRQADPDLDLVLSARGRAVLATSRTQCLGELSHTLAGEVIGDWFSADVSSRASLAEAVRQYLAVPEAGYREPVFLAHGTADVDVSFDRTARFAQDLADRGEPVTFRSYPGVDHAGTIDAARDDVTAFLADVMQDEATR